LANKVSREIPEQLGLQVQLVQPDQLVQPVTPVRMDHKEYKVFVGQLEQLVQLGQLVQPVTPVRMDHRAQLDHREYKVFVEQLEIRGLQAQLEQLKQ
jgi:hypothetical protein